jgi:hypothetical protein
MNDGGNVSFCLLKGKGKDRRGKGPVLMYLSEEMMVVMLIGGRIVD